MVKFHRKDINTKGVKSTKLLGLYFISLEVVLTIPIKKCLCPTQISQRLNLP